MIQSCVKYEEVEKKGEGTFSEVFKARNEDGLFYAIKHMKQTYNNMQEVCSVYHLPDSFFMGHSNRKRRFNQFSFFSCNR